jgi:hypothetical protein
VVSKPLPKSRSTDTKMSYIRLTTTTTTTGGGDYVDGGDDSIRPFLPLFDLSLVRIKNITKNSSQTAEKKTFSLLRIFSVKKYSDNDYDDARGPLFPLVSGSSVSAFYTTRPTYKRKKRTFYSEFLN